MRHVLLATALVMGAAHAQPAPARVRLRTVLDLAKRKDAPSILAVSHALTNDPEPHIRRLAALVLEKMIDANTGIVERDAAIAAVTAATQDPDKNVQATAARALGTIQRVTAAKQASAPPALVPPIGGPFCKTSASVPVSTENLTQWSLDVCAAFNRASASVTWPAVSTSIGLRLRVSLTQMQRARRTLTCKVTITTTSYSGTLSKSAGGASVALNPTGVGNQGADQDCVDAVIANLLGARFLATLGSTGAPPNAPPSAPPASSSGASSGTASATSRSD